MMAAVSAMHEQVHERARQDDQVRNPAQQMWAVLDDQIRKGYRTRSPDRPTKHFIASVRRFLAHFALPLRATGFEAIAAWTDRATLARSVHERLLRGGLQLPRQSITFVRGRTQILRDVLAMPHDVFVIHLL